MEFKFIIRNLSIPQVRNILFLRLLTLSGPDIKNIYLGFCGNKDFSLINLLFPKEKKNYGKMINIINNQQTKGIKKFKILEGSYTSDFIFGRKFVTFSHDYDENQK